MKGMSLHIGLNSVDPKPYDGWSGDLNACENDARAMEAIAKSLRYQPKVFLTGQATADAVCAEITAAAKKLATGDMFLLSYSGHGGQVPDTGGDEPDGKDETWILYDRELIDDELYALWGMFRKGVRIFVLSDSCHSGSVTRAYYRDPQVSAAEAAIRGHRQLRSKAMPPDVQDRVYRLHRKMYDDKQKQFPDAERKPLRASVILISGCQDNQLSSDGDVNGLFTEKLLQTWNGGAFTGNYRRFHRNIVAGMPPSQTPKYSLIGASNALFEQQKPFVLAKSKAAAGGRQ